MLNTWEIRWFGRGPIPRLLQSWSEKNQLITQPVRSDYYMLNPGNELLGIKWREGNIQVKELMAKDGVYENYQKWSFELKEDKPSDVLKNSNKWLAVKKKREMSTYVLENGGFTLSDEYVLDQAIELELSAAIVEEDLWWTVAFEAIGGKDVLVKALKEFKPKDIPNDSECMGYAEWLTKNSSYE